MIKKFDEFAERAKKGAEKKTVVVAAAQDPHTLEAVFQAADEGVVDYLLVGKVQEIKEAGKRLGHEIPSGCIISAETDEEAAAGAVKLIRERKGQILMKGKLETGTLLREVVKKETGIGTGRLMSHMCILQIPAYHKIVGFTDGGMVLYPDFEQKRGILENAASMFRSLGYEKPKIAAVAAIEKVNPKMPETTEGEKLKELACEGAFGSCILEGPISMDLTFSREAAEIKGYSSPVTGDVDIVLVPDIAVGNISTKALICLSGAQMAGCILGAAAPIVLSSRGASFGEKYSSLMLCAAMEQERQG